MGRLENKVCVITGAAQGLGQALAKRLSEEGAKVVVADMNLEGAQATAASLKDGCAIQVDVTKFEDCEKMVALAVEKYGKCDLLISNAGVVISGAIEEFDPAKWKLVVDINLCGFFNAAKAAVSQFRKQGYGNIIQINSKSGKKGSAKNSAYAASKFGGIGLVESLALELAQENIRVNAICPGNMLSSPLWVNSLFKQYAHNQGITEEQVKEKYINQVPMRRGCEYEDIANVMVFLASEESSYMTGQALNVTGGQQMQP